MEMSHWTCFSGY